MSEEDIEAAYVQPSRPPKPTATTSGAQSTRPAPPPTIVERFCRKDVRDKVIRSRKLLKDSKISIVEDLTALNIEVMNRLRNSDDVQKTWSWNGHVCALLKSGEKVQVRPFQAIEECRHR